MINQYVCSKLTSLFAILNLHYGNWAIPTFQLSGLWMKLRNNEKSSMVNCGSMTVQKQGMDLLWNMNNISYLNGWLYQLQGYKVAGINSQYCNWHSPDGIYDPYRKLYWGKEIIDLSKGRINVQEDPTLVVNGWSKFKIILELCVKSVHRLIQTRIK